MKPSNLESTMGFLKNGTCSHKRQKMSTLGLFIAIVVICGNLLACHGQTLNSTQFSYWNFDDEAQTSSFEFPNAFLPLLNLARQGENYIIRLKPGIVQDECMLPFNPFAPCIPNPIL
jgi:hypothetical protein